MTTAAFSSRIRHDTDATFQEWRDEFITKLAVLVAGGKLAADETNITPGAGTRTTNTEQGYAVYHLSDSLHGTAPVYIRFGFGTGGTITFPRLQMTCGTSTNGAGVLGGTCLSTIVNICGQAAQTTDTARASYMCASDGFLGFNWKQASSAEGAFYFCRTVDNTGAISATGGLVFGSLGTNPTICQPFRYAATAVAYSAGTITADASVCNFPHSTRGATLVGSDIQVALAWTITPAVAPLLGMCGVLNGEVPANTTFSATLVGSTPHTYIAWTAIFPSTGNNNFPMKYAMLYE